MDYENNSGYNVPVRETQVSGNTEHIVPSKITFVLKIIFNSIVFIYNECRNSKMR